MKIILTHDEYNKLQELLNVVKDKNNASGIRRLAMTEFNFILKNRKQLNNFR